MGVFNRSSSESLSPGSNRRNSFNFSGYATIGDHQSNQPTPNPGIKPEQQKSGPSTTSPVPAVIKPASVGDHLSYSTVEDEVACSCLCRRTRQSAAPNRTLYPIEYFIINLMKMRPPKKDDVTDEKVEEE